MLAADCHGRPPRLLRPQESLRRHGTATTAKRFCLSINVTAESAVRSWSRCPKRFPRTRRKDVKLYIKLPSWFTVATPIGEYNPDWATPTAAYSGEKPVPTR
ncbi:MAG: hypothetical protein ACREEE_14005 [Dongiaceae bacterium]